ncbi:MAG TPA: aminotransferase class I/II-fold pyridoxal phosphate-dependent enzyme [Candidatus Eremiobacteraceae bacterium]|nr:aminotransferase class I/II-fold pyridoxal phosphate-dependent enzyme [Candidatus Eremiobacteraceae bacterium]
MRIAEFKLERYFARWEFVAKLLLGSSDAESFGLEELLTLADDDSRKLWRDMRFGYTESPGHPELREAIARNYDGISADDVLVFAGAEEAIFTFANVALAAGDHAVVMWPAYQSLHETARAAGADVSLLRLRYDKAWALDPDQLASLVRPTTACVVFNIPHNPTGAIPERRAFEASVTLCERTGARLFVDEVYRYGELDEKNRLPAACEASPTAVSLGGLAKPFGLAGLRIGWIATRDRPFLRRLAAFKDYLTICSSAPSELLAIAALRARDRVLARNKAIALANLSLLDELFARRAEELEWIRPPSWPIGFPRLLRAEPIEEFAARLVEHTGVMIAPETIFDHRGNHFRIGFGRRDMPRALERFEAFLDA